MSMARPRAAIVGAGLMGRWHARYAARAGAVVAGIVDPQTEAAAALHERIAGTRVFGTLEACLEARAADVVHVCTGSDSHVRLAETALDAGCHVLAEKPLALSRADATRLVGLAREKGLRLCPVHQLPFQRGVARAVADRERLGELLRAEYVVRSAGGEGRAPEARRALVLEILPHPVSLFRKVLGQGVRADDWSVLTSGDDELELTGRDGSLALRIDIGLRARPTRHELILAGSRATARVDLFHGYAVFDEGGTSRADKALAPLRWGTRLLWAAGTNLARRALAREPAFPGLRELIRRFYASIAEGTPPPIDPDEAVEAAALVERVSGTPTRRA
jgi:predicted dehydrogenase